MAVNTYLVKQLDYITTNVPDIEFLSVREQDFIADMDAKVRNGDRLSEKQKSWLCDIADKVEREIEEPTRGRD